MAGLIVTTEHLRTIPGRGRKPGYCVPHSRAFAAAHGLCWRSFVRAGVPAELLLATGDALAVALVEHAQAYEEARHGQ